MNNTPDDPRNRRLVRVPITFELLTILITKATEPKRNLWLTTTCTVGLPEGAVLVRTYVDEESQCAYGVYFHDSFEPVEMGAIIPELVPMFHHEHSISPFVGLKLELHGSKGLTVSRNRSLIARHSFIRSSTGDEEDSFEVRTQNVREQIGITRDVIKHFGPQGLIEIVGYEGEEITDARPTEDVRMADVN